MIQWLGYQGFGQKNVHDIFCYHDNPICYHDNSVNPRIPHLLGAKESAPDDQDYTDGNGVVTAGRCPIGHYCPAGTTTPDECPPGRWADSDNVRL